jgi:hypothetical protein
VNHLRWTGHHRTIAVVFALFMVGSLMVSGPLLWIHSASDRTLLIDLCGGLALAIPTFTWLCVFVRCPRCRTRLIWHAVSKDDHPRGLNAMLLATKCPFCGFPEPTAS